MKICNTLYIIFSLIGCVFGASLMSGCADEMSLWDKEGTPEGYIRIDFSIPEAEIVSTRGNDNLSERVVKSLTILIFDNSGTKVLQRYDAGISEISNINQESTERNSFSFSFPLEKVAKNEENKIVYALANCITKEDNTDRIADFQTGVEKSVEYLETITADRHYGIDNGFIMTGKVTNADNEGIKIELHRSMGKVTLKDESGNSNFHLDGYKVYNSAKNGYLTAALVSDPFADKDNDREPIEAKLVDDNGVERWDCYVLPTKTHTGTSVSTYVVVEGTYAGQKGYYAVPIYKRDLAEGENNGDHYFDIKPNHWYEMTIEKVLGPGYASEDDALANPMPTGFDINIHDHVASVFSMTSDGIRELGTYEKIDMTGNSFDLIVKCFSKITEDENEEPKVEITDGSDWLAVSQTGNIVKALTSGDQDSDNPGTQWSFHLSLNEEARIYNDKHAIIEVTWKNLKRIVEVVHHAEFNPENACTARVYTYEGEEEKYYNEDYWYLLKNDINGINPEDMEGAPVRNQGFHFFMPFGENAPESPWETKYELDFKKMAGSRAIDNITISVAGDQYFKDNLAWDYPKKDKAGFYFNVGTLYLKGGVSDYTYALGSVTFTLDFEGGGSESISFSLYHTGFFYMPEYFSNDTPKKGYFYYEVISLGGYHWLDRNIGASSNKMYVNNGDEGSFGDENAAGVLFTIAKPGENYGNPTLNTDPYKDACPPGYTVPGSADWDNIRLSANFRNERISDGGQNYVTTYYLTSNSRVPKVYFPKSKYFNSGYSNTAENIYKDLSEANAGDNGAGYYWTFTPSQGLEENQIGKWLKALYLNGNSSTYINGSILDHKMNVRCIAKSDLASAEMYSIDFNVKGATHVYLYTIDGSGNKTGLFTFPGKAIGRPESVESLVYEYDNPDEKNDNSYIHFSYSSTKKAEELWVLFIYRDNSGKITLISENGEQTLKEATGWPVKVGYNYFFYKDGQGGYLLDKDGVFKERNQTVNSKKR